MEGREDADGLDNEHYSTNIQKQGRQTAITNYRGISFLCTEYKILTAGINNRLKKCTEFIIGEYQAGFRTGKFTTDQIFAVKKLLEKAWKRNVEINLIFGHFQKTYDTIRRDKL